MGVEQHLSQRESHYRHHRNHETYLISYWARVVLISLAAGLSVRVAARLLFAVYTGIMPSTVRGEYTVHREKGLVRHLALSWPESADCMTRSAGIHYNVPASRIYRAASWIYINQNLT